MRITAATKFFLTLEPADCEQLSMRMCYQLAQPNAVLMTTGDGPTSHRLRDQGRLPCLALLL